VRFGGGGREGAGEDLGGGRGLRGEYFGKGNPLSVLFIIRIAHKYPLFKQFYVFGSFTIADEITGGEEWSTVYLTAPQRIVYF
jgi:hypothetical protein